MRQPNSPTQRDNKVVFPFFSFMSEQQSGTRSKTCLHLKNFKSFLVFAGKKEISGKSRCIKGSIFIIRNTIIAVNGVEHRKTSNIKKTGKRTNWFAEVIKVIYQFLREKKAERRKSYGK